LPEFKAVNKLKFKGLLGTLSLKYRLFTSELMEEMDELMEALNE
jgi:hypothetical protein